MGSLSNKGQPSIDITTIITIFDPVQVCDISQSNLHFCVEPKCFKGKLLLDVLRRCAEDLLGQAHANARQEHKILPIEIISVPAMKKKIQITAAMITNVHQGV